MKRLLRCLLVVSASWAALLSFLPSSAEEQPKVGPQTEQRFPPLKVPAGFKATLFACDPLIEYPSVIALGPRPRSLFVAIDYMTGLGTEIIRRDEVRLVEDSDGDGYADRATVFADGFNSIQGLAYYDHTMFVMHAPYLTVLRDSNRDGVVDERRELLTGLGLAPEKNPSRLHCANGVTIGPDGWLYLALGDNGCAVARPEGDRLVLQGGGILRCRPDGRGLHVFARGLRNIYDVALDAAANVFVRDNENDGGTYKIRVCHSFFGADHGYPYLYDERPTEALPPLADLGLGSSAGGLCYLERQFPPEYRGNLFFCEWGRSVVRYSPGPAGSGFAPVKEFEFSAGAPNDPYGFKPTDVVVDRDGALIVADWADGQRPRRGRARIYRITHGDKAPAVRRSAPVQRLAQLSSESYYERFDAQSALLHQGRAGTRAVREAWQSGRLDVHGRLHAVWLLAQQGGVAATNELLDLARTDADPQVQAVAVRTAADLNDPVLVRHRLDAGPGDAELAARLAALAEGKDARVVRETVIALGRLHWPEAPAWLQKSLTRPDPALAHAAVQTLRSSRNWPGILKLLDEPDTAPIRVLALRALADCYEPSVVDALIQRLPAARDAARRAEVADLLTRVYKKPGPWVYWGYRPQPRAANTLSWERTEAIERALDRVLADADRGVRRALLQRMQREKVPTRLTTLRQWLEEEQEAGAVAAILEALREHPGDECTETLVGIVRGQRHAPANRLQALAMLDRALDKERAQTLLALADSLEGGPVLAAALRSLGQRRQQRVGSLVLAKTRSPAAAVRAAALDALADLRLATARAPVRRLLEDPDASVRMAAADAAGKLGLGETVEMLLKLAGDGDGAVRRASLRALRLLHEPRVVALAVSALTDPQTELEALHCLGELGGPDQTGPVGALARRSPSAEVLTKAVQVLTTWRGKEGLPGPRQVELDRAVAEIHGASGVLLRWQASGALSAQEGATLLEQQAMKSPSSIATAGWRTMLATGTEARVNLGAARAGGVWLGTTELDIPEQVAVEFLAASSGALRVWLNGARIYQRDPSPALRSGSTGFSATLKKGLNRILVQVSAVQGTPVFSLRFRRRSATLEREKFVQAALTRKGNAQRGRKLFFDAERLLCSKCHRLDDQGERIGPELTGVGSRFSAIYLVESILEPSRTIAPSFETVVVALKDGRLVTGVRVAETDTQLTLGDNQGQKVVLAKADIEERHPQAVSLMPEGLEQRFTVNEFVDLVSFLVSQKETHTR